MEPVREKRDLVLPPGSYAYMQDVTKGVIKTYTGPTVINPTAQEVPVVFDPSTGVCRRANSLEEAMCTSPVAPEGFYIMLRNPAKANKHPSDGSAQPADELDVGRTIVIPGPATFPLWPGQVAEVVEGHHLRSNRYLLVRVYNEEEARKNWFKAVVKPAAVEGETPVPTSTALPPDLTIGKQLIIRGTEVSFYIPPTGVEVVVDGEDANQYVRDALTLERLEYAILVDENGKKRYEKGPQVVFPLPSEQFIEGKDDNGKPTRKFRAIELNEIQGLHIKVIAAYEENGKAYKEGDELFITGKDTAIYYPREEHSAIKYDGKAKHFASAIPAGEARYVLNRLTGNIKMVKGPAMLLPDPRSEVIVRRVLTDKLVDLMYPGNTEAMAYNQSLRQILANVPTTRSGAVSEGDFERNSRSASGSPMRSKGVSASVAGGGGAFTAGAAQFSAANAIMDSSLVSGDQKMPGEEFSRASSYTSPRTITLDTKYHGVPSIDVWTGYAVMVVSKTGNRRVEKGPVTVLLEYDEALEGLELSTGKPKTTEKLLKTAFLRVENNGVSDIVTVETADHVQVQLYVRYMVNFEGEPTKWFAIENYVKFMCDHARSVLKGAVRRVKVEDFYANSTDYIRDAVLGKSPEPGKPRLGMPFPENGMRVLDVEVLKVTLQDERIRQLLEATQHEVVKTNVEVSALKRRLDVTKQIETVAIEEAEVKAASKKRQNELVVELAAGELSVTLAKLANKLREIEEQKKAQEAQEKMADVQFQAAQARSEEQRKNDIAWNLAIQNQSIDLLKAEAEAVVKRFTAALPGFSEALLALSANDTLVKVAEAWNIQRALGGESVSDALQRVFAGTPLGTVVQKLAAVVPNGNGSATKTATT